MATNWDLNPIVLSHTQRFFQSVTYVVDNWQHPDRAFLGSIVALLGNLAWAASAFHADTVDQEKAMAYGGALAGTLGGDIPAGDTALEEAAEAILAAQERQLFGAWDALLEHLATEAPQGASPAALNAWVWDKLFPAYPWGLSQVELQETIKARLAELAAG